MFLPSSWSRGAIFAPVESFIKSSEIFAVNSPSSLFKICLLEEVSNNLSVFNLSILFSRRNNISDISISQPDYFLF
jgi:hypothetical protein